MPFSVSPRMGVLLMPQTWWQPLSAAGQCEERSLCPGQPLIPRRLKVFRSLQTTEQQPALPSSPSWVDGDRSSSDLSRKFCDEIRLRRGRENAGNFQPIWLIRSSLSRTGAKNHTRSMTVICKIHLCVRSNLAAGSSAFNANSTGPPVGLHWSRSISAAYLSRISSNL